MDVNPKTRNDSKAAKERQVSSAMWLERKHKFISIVCLALVAIQLLSFCSEFGSAQIYRRTRRLIPTRQPSLAPPAPRTPPTVSSALSRSARQQHQQDNVVAEMQVVCQSDAILLQVNTNHPFNGMLYARDAADSAGCMSEFRSATNMTFRLPLKTCGTLSAEVDDGIEYFNTIVVQPHMRLMTNRGKGYHVRCKYQTRERTIANTQFNVSAAFQMQNGPQSSTAPLLATASMPMCTMKIYRIDQDNVAESVRVGDKLVMVIEIDRQDMYGMRVTNCVVRDGLNKAEQLLLDENGCPADESIMPKFDYENNSTRATVAFKAHKFPHTSSVYYQCNVRLCINNGACEPVTCDQSASASSVTPTAATGGAITPAELALSNRPTGGPRRKRFVEGHQQLEASPGPGEQVGVAAASNKPAGLSFDVYSGLYVSDITDMAESDAGDPSVEQVIPAQERDAHGLADERRPRSILTGQSRPISCLTTGKAALLVIVAGLGSLTLMLLLACQAGLIARTDNH